MDIVREKERCTKSTSNSFRNLRIPNFVMQTCDDGKREEETIPNLPELCKHFYVKWQAQPA